MTMMPTKGVWEEEICEDAAPNIADDTIAKLILQIQQVLFVYPYRKRNTSSMKPVALKACSGNQVG